MNLPAIRIRAGSGRALAGVWVRKVKDPSVVLLPTVAHVLFTRDGKLRESVSADGVRAKITAIVPLQNQATVTADTALLGFENQRPRGIHSPGHLRKFSKGLDVWRIGSDGDILRGRLASEGWSGRFFYNFGSRRLTKQWIVDLNMGGRGYSRTRLGESGCTWMTDEQVVVGLQVGILAARPQCIVLTPMATLCDIFSIRVAVS